MQMRIEMVRKWTLATICFGEAMGLFSRYKRFKDSSDKTRMPFGLHTANNTIHHIQSRYTDFSSGSG